MTREEAVKWLKLLKSSPLIYGEYQEAIDISIEALSEDIIPFGRIAYDGVVDLVSGVLTVDKVMDMEQAIEWCKDCQHNEVCRYYPYDGCEFKDTSDMRGEVE